MATFWATFVEANLLHFHLNKQFQNIVLSILAFQKWFGVDVLDFQIAL